jgi:hypothetical protein
VDFATKNLPRQNCDLQKRMATILLTTDVKNGWIVAEANFMPTAKKLYLTRKYQDDIWGWNCFDKQIDTTAVLNIRPRLANDNFKY